MKKHYSFFLDSVKLSYKKLHISPITQAFRFNQNDKFRLSKVIILLIIIYLFPCLLFAQCGNENFELLIETSLGTGQICENSSANVSVDVTPESYYFLEQIDSMRWDWFSDSPFENDIAIEITYPPFNPSEPISHLYDDLAELDCDELIQLFTTPPNKVEMSIKTTAFATCDDGNVEKHSVEVGFDLLLAPRAQIEMSATSICFNETAEFENVGCFGVEDLSYWTVNGVDTIMGTNEISYSPNTTGQVEVCLHLENSCGVDVACKTLTVIPLPNAQFTMPPELLDGEGCAGTYEFCNESDTIFFNNLEYYWELYYDGSLQGQIDTQQYKNCFVSTFNETGPYELVLTATNFACDDAEYVYTFNIIPSASATLNPSTYCITDFSGYTPNVTYTGIIMSYEWTFENGTPASSTDSIPMNIDFPPGTHNVTLLINSACGIQTYQTIVSIETPTEISFSDFEDQYCTGQGDTIKIIPSSLGGTWNSPAFVNDSCLVIGNLPLEANTLTYTFGSGACTSSESIDIFINDTTAIAFDSLVETFCEDDGIIMLGGVTPSGGTWSGIGVTDAINGLVDVSIIGVGNTATIWYTYVNPDSCISQTSKTLIIEGLPEASLPQDSLLLCDVPGGVDLNEELSITLLPGYTDEWIGDCVTAEGILDPVCLGIGNFNLGYIVFTPNGCTDTTDFTIIVGPYLEADAGDDLSECVSEGATINLTGMPVGGSWEGTNVSEDGVIIINSSMNGDYIYTYIYGGANCENEDVVTVNIINLNDISASLPDYCETEMIVTLPNGSPADGIWIYNGSQLTNDELDISTLGPGNYVLQYEVEETTSTNEVCTNSVPVDLFIDALPNPLIEIPSNFCINVPDTIINNTTEVYNSWNWDFGNGSTATGLTPIIEYESTGNYTITLNIQDTVCQQMFTWDVEVSSPPPPLDFDLDILSLDSCELLEVAFINQSQVDPNVTDVIYLWDFGNGILDTTYSVNEAPDNIFFEAFDTDTIYTVTLSALNNCGVVTPATATVYVKPKPVSEFSSDFEIYCSGATVNFINSSTGNPENTIIDLGDGTPLIFDYPFDTLSHQYFVGDVTEEITIQFISINPCGSDTILNTIEIVPVEVVSAFTVESNGEFCQNSPLCLINAATPGATVWYDMGDGSILFASDTCYVYSEIGNFIITQYASDICGGLDTLQTPITILEAPVISISSASTICLGDSITFNLSVSDDVIDVDWDFGDGNTSIELNPVHVYEEPGTYTVTSTASSLNCSIADSVTVNVEELIEVSFSLEDSICQDADFLLQNTSVGSNFSCLWTIDESINFPTCDLVTSIPTTGLHNVSLTITDNINGCKNRLDSFVFVRPTPSTAFEIQQLDDCEVNEYILLNQSTNTNSAFWDLGDGTTSSQLDTLEHAYAQSGSYTVRLSTSFDGICFDTSTQIIEVPDSTKSIFNILNLDGCEPFNPMISNQSTGNNLAFNWSTDTGLNFFSSDFAPSFTTDQASEVIRIRLIVIDTISNCRDTSEMLVTVYDSPIASMDVDHVSCAGGEDGSITVEASGGNPEYQYDWTVPGATSTLSNLPAGVYSLTITDSKACTFFDSIEVTEPSPILIEIDEIKNATCSGLEDGFIDIQVSGGTTTSGNEFVYDWSFNQPGSADPQDVIHNLGSGFYLVTITDENGCTEVAEFTIEDGYVLEVIDTISGISCEDMIDGQIQIASIGNGVPNFLALLDGTQTDTINSSAGIFSFKDLPAGSYKLSIIDQNNCMYEEEYLVPSWEDPEVSIDVDKPDTLYRCDTALVIAYATGSNLSYQWFPEVDFTCLSEDCDSIVVSPRIDITYKLTVTDEKGCSANDEVAFIVDEDRSLYIPTAFTPNGDGNNDIFRIRVGGHQEFLLSEIGTFNVLDRWGNVVFKAENFHPYLSPEIGWDGRIDQINAPSDFYVYLAELKFCDGQSKIEKGHVQLIR